MNRKAEDVDIVYRIDELQTLIPRVSNCKIVIDSLIYHHSMTVHTLSSNAKPF